VNVRDAVFNKARGAACVTCVSKSNQAVLTRCWQPDDRLAIKRLRPDRVLSTQSRQAALAPGNRSRLAPRETRKSSRLCLSAPRHCA